MTPTPSSVARAREIVDEHFPNYARQTVPVSVRDLETAIALALDAQREADANVAESFARAISIAATVDCRVDMLHNEQISKIAAAIRRGEA